MSTERLPLVNQILQEVRSAVLMEVVEYIESELPNSPSRVQTDRMKYAIGLLTTMAVEDPRS